MNKSQEEGYILTELPQQEESLLAPSFKPVTIRPRSFLICSRTFLKGFGRFHGSTRSGPVLTTIYLEVCVPHHRAVISSSDIFYKVINQNFGTALIRVDKIKAFVVRKFCEFMNRKFSGGNNYQVRQEQKTSNWRHYLTHVTKI